MQESHIYRYKGTSSGGEVSRFKTLKEIQAKYNISLYMAKRVVNDNAESMKRLDTTFERIHEDLYGTVPVIRRNERFRANKPPWEIYQELSDKGKDDEAEAYLRLAAARGHPKSQFLVGKIEKNRENPKEASRWWHMAARNGYNDSFYCLGELFEQSDDLDLAVYWYRKGIDVGCVQCSSKLKRKRTQYTFNELSDMNAHDLVELGTSLGIRHLKTKSKVYLVYIIAKRLGVVHRDHFVEQTDWKGTPVFICKLCRVASNTSDLNTPCQGIVDQGTTYMCLQCNSNYSSRASVRGHIHTMHKKI